LELAERNTPEIARHFHFRMNMPFESFESFYDKHGGRNEEIHGQ